MQEVLHFKLKNYEITKITEHMFYNNYEGTSSLLSSLLSLTLQTPFNIFLPFTFLIVENSELYGPLSAGNSIQFFYLKCCRILAGDVVNFISYQQKLKRSLDKNWLAQKR